MRKLTTGNKVKYLFMKGQNLFWMRPGVDVEFYWRGTWYRAKIESDVCEDRGNIQVPLFNIDENFVKKYLAINKTAIRPSKVRKLQWNKK